MKLNKTTKYGSIDFPGTKESSHTSKLSPKQTYSGPDKGEQHLSNYPA